MSDDVYVSLRPCQCRHIAVAADVPNGLETMPAKLTAGWSLSLRAADAAARIPTACDVCAPVRQGQLL